MISTQLKEYIQQNNKIEYVLEQLGCHHIHFHPGKDFYSAAQPDGDNELGVVIKNNLNLSYYSYSRGIDVSEGKDMFNLVQDIKGIKFIDALKYLHSILGLKFTYQAIEEIKDEKPKFDPLAIFKRALSHRRICNVADIKFLDESVLDDYAPMIHIDMFREGIVKRTIDKFELGYSYRWGRTIFPHRHWFLGELTGVNARHYLHDCEELGIKKYFLTPGMHKEYNLYGLWQNREDIEKAGYVVVFESEKSVLKRDSLLDPTGVALSGKNMSEEQVRILIGIDVHEIVICLDEGVDINEIRHMCEKFYRIRKVSYMYDKWNLLNEKESPADCKNKIYQFLFKYRVEYDEHEHQLYLESLNKQ